MVDDVFRGRATIDDKLSPGLRAMREEWARFNKSLTSTSAGSRREVDAMRGAFRAIGTEIRGFTLPALSAFGLAGGGFAAGVIGFGKAAKDYADKIQDLGIASKELGVSARNVRAFELAASNVRIAPQAAIEGLRTFSKNAHDFRYRLGGVRDELMRLGAGDVVERIRQAQDPVEKLRISFARIQELQTRDPEAARRMSELLFGSAEFARMGWDEFRKSMEKVGNVTDAEIERAERLNAKWNEIGRTWEKLKDKVLGGNFSDNMQSALDKAGKGADWLGGMLGKIPDSPGWDSKVEPLDPNQRAAPSRPSNGMLRLPRMIDPRQKEETKEGVKSGVIDGLTEYFQRTSASQMGGGGFMNAALGGTSGTLPSGGAGKWGGGGYTLEGFSTGKSGGGGSAGTSEGLLPGAVDRSGAGAGPAGSKNENAQRIYNELRKLGHTHEQASAALGHAQHESGFNPNVRGDAGTAHGFWQHRGKRWELAKRMAGEAGTSPYSPEAAARHFDFELRNGERAAGRNYFASKSTRDAVTALNGYERFAGWQRGQPGRYSSAEGFARRMRETGEAPPAAAAATPPSFGDRFNQSYSGSRDRSGDPQTPGFDDRWNDRINGALGGANQMSATGTVNLNVTAPSGTKVDASSDGLFKKTTVQRYKQMSETGYDGGAQ